MAHTNVEDPQYLNDGLEKQDFKRDVVGFQEDVRACFRDASPVTGANAVIIEGGNLLAGPTPDTFKVTSLRARDNNQFPAVVAADVDNVALEDANEDVYNYVAVRHTWDYSSSRPAYDTGVPYYAVRADGYEINVATASQDEANGYVVLGSVHKHDGNLVFDFTKRSRDVRLYLTGFTIYISGQRITAAGVMFDQDALRLSPLFSWEDKVVLFQLADGWSDSTSALPVDLQTTVRITTAWQVIGVLKNALGGDVEISVKVDPALPRTLQIKAAAETVDVRGLITLLGGAYNFGTAT